MLNLNSLYHPMVSRPFFRNETYNEYTPCEGLKPFIHCYWGTAWLPQTLSRQGKQVLVVPDTCMDIIIEINHTANSMRGIFSCIHDKPFLSKRENIETDVISRFAVRFYFWAVHLFTGVSFQEMLNQTLDLNVVFPDWKKVFEPFYYIHTMEERILIAEQYLQERMDMGIFNHNFFNTVFKILDSSGTESVKEVCEYSAISQRQMERLFIKNIGISLKKTSTLIRYQNVWNDIVLSEDFDVHEVVERYRYTDQSHLLNEFKRFHGVTPKQALEHAKENR